MQAAPASGPPNSSQDNIYRIHADETISLVSCHAKAEATFKHREGVDYAMLTVIPREGPPISQAVMGGGTTVRFKCSEISDALLSVVTLDDSKQFADVALSITTTGAH